MLKRSNIKCFVAILIILAILSALVLPAYAAKVEPTQVREVLFTADCPIDFDEVILITATSKDTGYIYSYNLTSESGYRLQTFVPYGEYSISATISPLDGASDDATVYIVTPISDTLFVEEGSIVPSFSFTVEGYTNTDQGEEGSTGNDSFENTTNDKNDAPIDSGNEFSDSSNQEKDSETPVVQKSSSVWKSLVFYVMAILIFFVCGHMYRKYKEG